MESLLKERGIGQGWLRESDLDAFRLSRGMEVLRIYNIYECEHCHNLQPARLTDGKITQCPGCGKKHDTDVEVHDMYYKGAKVFNVAGLMTEINGEPIRLSDRVRAPLKCGHCEEIIPEKSHNCPSCGASKATATLKPVQWGENWELKLDDSELQGFTAKKPEPEPVTGNEPAPSRRRLPDMSRRQWGYVGGTGALATGIAAYFYANSGPTLEEPDEESGEIVNMEWFEDIVIQKRQGKGWERKGKLYRANGNATNNPNPSAPQGVPPDQLNDPSQYRVTYEGRYVVHVKSRGKVVARELNRDEYMQYRVDDKVSIRVKENGAVQGMDRTGRSK